MDENFQYWNVSIQALKKAKLTQELNDTLTNSHEDYKNWIISQVSNNNALTSSYFNNEITQEQLYDNILDLYFEEKGVVQFQEMIDNEEVYFPQTVTDNHNLADIITDLIWANLANDFINNISKEDVKNVILTALLSNALDKNKKIEKGLKSLLKFPNKIGKGKEISNLVNSGFKVLNLYEKAKGLLNVENSNQQELNDLIYNIGVQDPNGLSPLFRKIIGTEDEAEALFNMLAKGKLIIPSSDGLAKFFWADNNHTHKVIYRKGSSTGANATIDFQGPKYISSNFGGNSAKLKFYNQ